MSPVTFHMNDRIANLVLPALTMRQILIIVSLEFLTLLHQSGYCQTGVKDDLASQAQATQLIGKCDLEVLLSVSRKWVDWLSRILSRSC